MARVEDKSVHYILPNHMMLKICTELPREMEGILACCNPVPPMVKQNLGTLHSILLDGREGRVRGRRRYETVLDKPGDKTYFYK